MYTISFVSSPAGRVSFTVRTADTLAGARTGGVIESFPNSPSSKKLGTNTCVNPSEDTGILKSETNKRGHSPI